jgi:hypothetical protein
MAANKTILVAALVAALLSIGVVSSITMAMAEPNDNPSCVGNPYPDGITGNAHGSGGNHHCPGQK